MAQMRVTHPYPRAMARSAHARRRPAPAHGSGTLVVPLWWIAAGVCIAGLAMIAVVAFMVLSVHGRVPPQLGPVLASGAPPRAG